MGRSRRHVAARCCVGPRRARGVVRQSASNPSRALSCARGEVALSAVIRGEGGCGPPGFVHGVSFSLIAHQGTASGERSLFSGPSNWHVRGGAVPRKGRCGVVFPSTAAHSRLGVSQRLGRRVRASPCMGDTPSPPLSGAPSHPGAFERGRPGRACSFEGAPSCPFTVRRWAVSVRLTLRFCALEQLAAGASARRNSSQKSSTTVHFGTQPLTRNWCRWSGFARPQHNFTLWVCGHRRPLEALVPS
jgi:hypothetical protein